MSTSGGRNLSLSSKKQAKHRNPSSPARKYFGPYKSLFDEVVSPSSIEFSPEIVHETLNVNIWNSDKTLKQEIRLQLLKIAKKFHEFLKIDLKIKDVVFTGSMANYNWTSTSDIDVHLILTIDGTEEEKLFVNEFLITKKTIWNFIHDIKIKTHEVELYAKDEETELSDKGIFSLAKNKWLIEPSKKSPIIDIPAIKEKTASLMTLIDSLEAMKDDGKKAEKASRVGEKIRNFRQTGLDDKGEYSVENLVFKVLRRNGYLEKLSDIKTSSFDNSMSIKETISESKKKKNKTYEYGCLMVYFDLPGWSKLEKEINKEDIYDKEGLGFESEPHTTVLYGFHNDVDVDDIKDEMKGQKPIKIKLKKLGVFENKDYDVLKFDIESDDLVKLNKKMVEFPHTTDFPKYHPHMTVSYLKKGTGKKYIDKIKKKFEEEGIKMVYSKPTADGKSTKKHRWNLKKKKLNENMEISTPQTPITLGIENGIEGMTSRKKELIEIFLNFVVNKLGLTEPVELYIHKGRDEYIVTTASYVPSENSNHVKAEGRALVDICRSIAHELVHNKQREIGKFNSGDQVQNIGGEIEDEANAIAGILIKDFTHNYGYDEIYDE